MVNTYKDIILSTPEHSEVQLKEEDISYDQLASNIEELKVNASSTVSNDSHYYMTELLYGVMDKVDILKDELKDLGFMNTFSYEDIHSIISKCVSLEIIPDVQSENESDFEEDEYVEI